LEIQQQSKIISGMLEVLGQALKVLRLDGDSLIIQVISSTDRIEPQNLGKFSQADEPLFVGTDGDLFSLLELILFFINGIECISHQAAECPALSLGITL